MRAGSIAMAERRHPGFDGPNPIIVQIEGDNNAVKFKGLANGLPARLADSRVLASAPDSTPAAAAPGSSPGSWRRTGRVVITFKG
jgi:hypothetical protein